MSVSRADGGKPPEVLLPTVYWYWCSSHTVFCSDEVDPPKLIFVHLIYIVVDLDISDTSYKPH